MSQIHPCQDRSDTVNLFPVLGLFLKPIARINITVHFPTLKQSISNGGGKSVSSWEVMERMKGLVAPNDFISLKVVKNTLEFIRFEGDLENRGALKTVVSRLDRKALKLTGFRELLKIRTAEAKIQFPSKYDWDSFFRDAKHMNEMKAGERPDTIHFQCLPCKWFSEKRSTDKPMPSEKLFRRVWETFGDVRCVDIPVLDPYRQQMQSNIAGIKTFTFSQDPVFEAYVQYKDYLSFVRAMDALRGCFLLYQEDNKSWVASVKVDFDKSKHMSDNTILQRRLERERLIDEEKLKERQNLQQKQAKNSADRQSAKEVEISKEEQKRMEYKIALEERMYMVARRKLESVRLLDYLFERIKKHRLEARRAAGDEDDQRSLSSQALSPSFYNVERSPRIEKCKLVKNSKQTSRRFDDYRRERSPFEKGSNSKRRSMSPGKDRLFNSRREFCLTPRKDFSPIDRMNSTDRNRSPRRDRSRSRDSRGKNRELASEYESGTSHSPSRRSRSRNPTTRRRRHTGSRSPRRSRSPSEHKFNRNRHRSVSPFTKNSRGRDRSPSEHLTTAPKIYDRCHRFSANRYMNDRQLRHDGHRPVPVSYPTAHRGRPRGRPYGRGYQNKMPSYERYNPDPATLQEAYEAAYTKYFNSITKPHTATEKDEYVLDDRRDSRSPVSVR